MSEENIYIPEKLKKFKNNNYSNYTNKEDQKDTYKKKYRNYHKRDKDNKKYNTNLWNRTYSDDKKSYRRYKNPNTQHLKPQEDKDLNTNKTQINLENINYNLIDKEDIKIPWIKE